jgi:hypothetical protein
MTQSYVIYFKYLYVYICLSLVLRGYEATIYWHFVRICTSELILRVKYYVLLAYLTLHEALPLAFFSSNMHLLKPPDALIETPNGMCTDC